jgi:hypothetical protein
MVELDVVRSEEVFSAGVAQTGLGRAQVVPLDPASTPGPSTTASLGSTPRVADQAVDPFRVIRGEGVGDRHAGVDTDHGEALSPSRP